MIGGGGGGGGGGVTECIVGVPAHDPLIFSFRFLFLFDWVGVLWLQLSKLLKLVRLWLVTIHASNPLGLNSPPRSPTYAKKSMKGELKYIVMDGCMSMKVP